MEAKEEQKKLLKRLILNCALIFFSLLCVFLAEAIKKHSLDFSQESFTRLCEPDVYFIFLFSGLEILCGRYVEGFKLDVGWFIGGGVAFLCYGVILSIDNLIGKIVLVSLGFFAWIITIVSDYIFFRRWLNKKSNRNYNNNDEVGYNSERED